jgi:ribosomal protein S4E
MICMQKLVEVDGKTRTDVNFPAGFMGELPIGVGQFERGGALETG